MARDIKDRLNNLRQRRRGIDSRSMSRLSDDAFATVLAKSVLKESYEKRAVTQPFTQYALGAMQAVDGDYTRIGIETAERIGKQLRDKLSMNVDFRLQGSVPLDVHIRGVSDVDLLVIDVGDLVYATFGSKALAGYYTPSASGKTSLSVLASLRASSEAVLKVAYPAATVDCSGGKCISLSGGSLARPVDVVPSIWWDTIQYQDSGNERDRGVTILNKKVPVTIDNLPFLHIANVHGRDQKMAGSLKKAIRLVKNVKNDSENESQAAKLPSFDIAALLYHASSDALLAGSVYELMILREAQRFFDWCYKNQDQAKLLKTPDDSRCVLDSQAKMDGLLSISCELDDLVVQVAAEQAAALGSVANSWDQVDSTLRKAYIPAFQ